MRWDLRGEAALVTGAGSGIGQAIALALAEQGVSVGVADLDPARAQSTAAQIRQVGQGAVPVVMDVSEPAQVAHGVAEAEAATQRSAREAREERAVLGEWELSDSEAWAILEEEERRGRRPAR